MKYRKKPVIVEARILTDDNMDDLAKWSNGIIRINEAFETWIDIYTIEGIMKARIGDYIIQGIKGEFYPCKADIFEATYEELV
jgi:hypothetical protein